MTAETDVARPVVAYLRAIGWRVFQEVQTDGERPDIVATWRDRLVWIVECKTALSWDLLAQAEAWRGRAHRVSVAVPSRKWHGGDERSSRAPIEWRVLRNLGLGLFVAGAEKVAPVTRARPNRQELRHWWRTLRPEHESGFAEAGSPAGGYFTPFRGTVRAMADVLREHPGLTTRELIAASGHHYDSDGAAVRNMVRWIGTTALDGTGLCARKGPQGWRWLVDPLADVNGRCSEPFCALPAVATCRCRLVFCPLCLIEHRCACHANWGGCGPVVRFCGCGRPRVGLCAEHDRCLGCQRDAERVARAERERALLGPAAPGSERAPEPRA